ncbi:MAG TPA: hypothetical protein VF974_02225 [Patescibacteria group bacterium]
MDILAHGLWTNIMYKVIPATKANKKTTYWGIFFGIFPDLWAFTPVFVYIFYNWIFHGQKFHFARPEDGGIIPLSSLTHHLYSLSHSLVIWAVVFIIVWLIIKNVPWVLLGWALHICIDIFSHSSKFYPTPFLFPVSSFHIDGYPWSHPIFMIVNYTALVLLYVFVIPKISKRTLG